MMQLQHLLAVYMTLATFIFIPQPVNCANILFYCGMSTYSHRLVQWPLVEALAERNHTVTFFQPEKNTNPHPKVIEINPKIGGMSDQVNFLKDRLALGYRRLLLSLTFTLPDIGLHLCDSFLQDPKIVEWIKGTKFDLVVIDTLFNECGYGIAHLHGAKTILFGTTHPLEWLPDSLGYPVETSWIPSIHFSFDLPLNFAQRVLTTLSVSYFNIIRHLSFPKVEAILRERLGIADMPSIPDMMANTSLVLSNSHFSEELSRSLPPNFVSVAGMNCKEKSQLKPIPVDLQNFIDDGGEKGFILVSFGSGARISDAPEPIQDVFFWTFGNMSNVKFIWKWEKERPQRMPSNIKTVKWIPQQELLAHPKIRAFVFHGGLLSTHEGICHEVKTIVIPVFAEQDFNSERLQRTERGISLDISTVTQKSLEDALQRILYDERYEKNVREVSKRFMDRPQKPVDTAVWWTEYVLRHEDTSFMRPMTRQLTWYQLRSLDVWAFLFGMVALFLYSSIKTLQFAWTNAVERLKEKSSHSKIKIN